MPDRHDGAGAGAPPGDGGPRSAVPALEIRTPRGGRRIAADEPVFVIAELSGNHCGDLARARALVDAACDAGVDAVKLQTYTPDTMTIESDDELFRVNVNDAWAGQTLYDLYASAATPWEWHAELKERAESRGVMLFSAPFDASAVALLADLGVELYKVASFEIGDLPLLREIGARRRPVVVSRGLASPDEIGRALETLRDAGAPAVALLQCVSAYPARPDQMNLRTIPDLAHRFGTVVGLSDHTLGTAVAVASVALGASIVEKHFTLRRADGGPDAAFSLEPGEMRQLVDAVRVAREALGEPSYAPDADERENRVFRRSLFVVEDVEAGEALTPRNVRIIRPGNGLEPRHYDAILGRRAEKAIARGTPLSWDLVGGEGP